VSILLSDEELWSLYEQHEFYFKLYVFGIRRYMDYQTGIVGIKRRISYQSLKEEMFVETRKGLDREKCEAPTKARLQRALKHLEKIGLIEQIKNKDHLVFRCLLAKRDNSAQNKPDTKSIHFPDTRQQGENVDASGLAINPVIKPDTPKKTIPDTPPLSGKAKEKEILRISKKKVQLPQDFVVTDQHLTLASEKNWPDPHSEIDAFRDYHLSRGTTMLDWDRAFYTWLRNAEKFGGKSRGDNQQVKPNSFNRAIENIINSANRSR